jgi:pyruvate carboxylase subunit B
MKYLVTIGTRTVEVGVDGERVTVNGRVVTARAAPVPGTPLWRLEIDGRTVTLPLQRQDAGQWTALVHGGVVEIEALDERTKYIRSLAAAAKGPGGPASLKAPMPGLVVRVLVAPGQAVTAGQGVLVLEAMKMENELKASGPATVKAVHVTPGQAVEKGQVLMEFVADVETG